MVKYIKDEVLVCFSEIPDEIVLAINISNCPHHCKGCHSPYLQQDIGDELTDDILDELIKKNEGITCVCFMGEGNDLDGIFNLAKIVSKNNLNVGIYSGSKEIPDKFWATFNYIKLGGYKEEFGPLNKETTNQRMYKYDTCIYALDILLPIETRPVHPGWRDITYKFWRKDS